MLIVLVFICEISKIAGLLMPALHPVAPVFHPFTLSRATTRSILLSWTPSGSMEISHYELQVLLGEWSAVYLGKGRVFSWEANGSVIPGNAYSFRIRSVSPRGLASAWSAELLGHTLLPAQEERFPLELVGMGKNNPGHAKLVIDGFAVYNSSTATGLVLGIFARSNFNLVSLSVYDTFNDAAQADVMASALLALNSSYLVMVVSSDAWELNAHARLARAIDFCGGYHFGQWSRMPPVAVSAYTDITETADGSNFGHPYAFLGIPGSGAGMGFESLQLATGHYLAYNLAPRAVVRAIIFFDYRSGQYQIRNAATNSADYFKRQQVPQPNTLHNPLPEDRVVAPASFIERPSAYVSYLGSMPWQIELLLAANSSYPKPEYESTNTGFQIVLSRYLPYSLNYVDSRTGSFLQTELDRVWGGPSLRIDITTGALLNSALADALLMEDRPCYAHMLWRFNVSSETCAIFGSGCCTEFDNPGSPPLMKYGIGLWPSLCVNSESDSCRIQVKLSAFEKYPSEVQSPPVAEVWI